MPWDSWKLAHAYHRIGSGTTPTSGDESYYDDVTGTPWITTSELREQYISQTATNVTQTALDDFSALRVYAPNAVFMAMYGATIGRLGMTKISAACNQACCAFETSDIFHNRYLFYWLWHRKAELLSLSTGGGQPNLSQQDLKSEKALCPPIETQKRIAAFLDEKIEWVDQLIEKKQMMLDRFAEKRQAIITQAVTKGLNPAAHLDPSGLPWFEGIPRHWKLQRLTTICDFQSGKAHEPYIDPDGDYICVNARFVSTDGDAEKYCSKNLCPAAQGDILMVMSDLPNGRALARTFLVEDEIGYAVNQRVCRVRPKSGNSRYLSYQLNRNAQLLQYDDGSEQTHLSNSVFKKLLLLEPPLEEQQTISDYLDDLLHRLDTTAMEINDAMALLLEYRSALITAAVTGQIEDLR